MKYCSHCGASVGDTAAFCSGCGKSQTAAAAGRPGSFWKGVAAATIGLSIIIGFLLSTMASNSADGQRDEPVAVAEAEDTESEASVEEREREPAKAAAEVRSTEARAETSSNVIVEEPGFVGKLLGEKARVILTVPEGQHLELVLQTAISTETARTGDTFRVLLAEPILVEGHEAVPEGAELAGHVAHAERSGRVEGVAALTLELDRLLLPGGDELLVRADAMRFEASSTKKEDAVKVGGASGAGALVGAIVGGKKGAAIGAGIGAGAGAGVVLSTRGEEVVLGQGAKLTTTLLSSLEVELVADEEQY